MKFREFFDRIFIINLPERADRRAEMLKELEQAGLPLEPGRIEFFPAVKVADAAGFDNAGYHGCFRSHLEVLQKARAAGARRLLVLEDDAALSPRMHQDEEGLVEQLQSRPWGIVWLGHQLEGPADRPTELRPYPGAVLLSHFYAVNGTCLDRLIDFFESALRRPAGDPDGGPMSPDGALNFFLGRNPDVAGWVTTPNFGWQRSSRSDIMPRWFDGVPGLRQSVAMLRHVKRWLKKTS
jgi:glycosyl transferase, family 25